MNLKIVSISIILAVIVYALYMNFSKRNPSLSPIPEDGIKVIQIAPKDK